jgi:D-aminopeptidase
MQRTSVVRLSFLGVAAAMAAVSAQDRVRARDVGIQPGSMTPGPRNAITDVADVRVGHRTVSSGDRVRTGVTAILPHGGNIFRDKVPGAVFVGNAFGKLAGSTQVEELGTIESPIVLTNTLSVGTAIEAVVRWTLAQPGNGDVRSVNALVGETNDGGLNDIRGLHVTREHVEAAISGARNGDVEEGAVGAGAGTVAFGWKGGIGTSSRRVLQQAGEWTVGVLVQTNYGGKLTIAGVPVWKELTPPRGGQPPSRGTAPQPADRDAVGWLSPSDGSCMIVVATDAPLDARDLRRLAARAIFAMARTGSTYSNGSGDFAIAFSTHRAQAGQAGSPPDRIDARRLTGDALSPLFEAVLDATEEAIYNSLLKAVDTTGNGRTVRAIPLEPLKAVLKKYGR